MCEGGVNQQNHFLDQLERENRALRISVKACSEYARSLLLNTMMFVQKPLQNWGTET